MGGTAGKIATVVNPVSYIANAGLGKLVTGKNPLSVVGDVRNNLGLPSAPNPNNPATYGPLNMYMDPQGDSDSINSLGTNFSNQDLNQGQYTQQQLANYGGDLNTTNNQFIAQDAATRQANLSSLSDLLNQQAAQTFKQTLPGTAEDYNAGGLLNSTGYQQEVARQQANLAAQVQNQLAQQSLQNSNYTQQLKLGALQQQQGIEGQSVQAGIGAHQTALGATQTANQNALSRQFSLQDYAREANVAKQLGAQLAPKTQTGKGGAVSAGALGASAGAPFGPMGAAIGGLGGLGLGLGGGK